MYTIKGAGGIRPLKLKAKPGALQEAHNRAHAESVRKEKAPPHDANSALQQAFNAWRHKWDERPTTLKDDT